MLTTYYKWAWAGDWTHAPHWQPLTATRTAAPAMGKASFLVRYGSGKWEDLSEMANGDSLESYTYCYVQIRQVSGGQETILWTGIIPAESFALLGQSGETKTADQKLHAYGLDWLLDIKPDGGWVEPTDGADAVWLDYLPTFNRQYEYGGDAVIGNRLDEKKSVQRDEWHAAISSHVFAAAEGERWGNYDIATFLLNNYQAWNGAFFEINANDGIETALNSIIGVYDFNQMTIRQALNALICRNRGFSWTYTVDAEGKVNITPFSLLGEEIKIGDITIPANSHKIAVGLWEQETHSVVSVVQDINQTYDRIVVRGSKIKSCCTLRVKDGEIEKEFEKAWTAAEETAYKDAAKNSSGYSDLGDDEKAALNDKVRSSDRFGRVFTTLRIKRDWDWKIDGKIVNPLLDDEGKLDIEQQAKYWNFGKRLLNGLPFKVGFDYSGAGPVDKNPSNSEPELRSIVAFVKKDDKYQNIEALDGVSASVRPLSRELGIEVKLRPNYMAAVEHWDAESDEPGKYTDDVGEKGIDYEEIIVTAFIETDQMLQVHRDLNEYENRRTLVIDLPDAELWYVVPDTIIDIDASGELVEYGGAENIIRDDTERLLVALNAAIAWYSKPHNKITIESKGIDAGLPVGTMITDSDITGIGATGAVVTSIELNWQQEIPTTTIQTDFAELDFPAILNGDKNNGTSATPSIAVAARKIAKTQKDIAEIKSEMGRSPVRIGAGGISGGISRQYARITKTISLGSEQYHEERSENYKIELIGSETQAWSAGVSYKKGDVVFGDEKYKECKTSHTSDNYAKSFDNSSYWSEVDGGLNAWVLGYADNLLYSAPWLPVDSIVEVCPLKDFDDDGKEIGELKWYILETVMKVATDKTGASIKQLVDCGKPWRVGAVFR